MSSLWTKLGAFLVGVFVEFWTFFMVSNDLFRTFFKFNIEKDIMFSKTSYAVCMCVVSQGGPVEILPFLFLGSARHSSQRDLLQRCGITAVLNVSSSCPNLFENELSYMTLRVEDSMAADIRVLFPQAIHFIGKLRFYAFSFTSSFCF